MLFWRKDLRIKILELDANIIKVIADDGILE
jgi:hypothetical protein